VIQVIDAENADSDKTVYFLDGWLLLGPELMNRRDVQMAGRHMKRMWVKDNEGRGQ
jgi:hypothetical protein